MFKNKFSNDPCDGRYARERASLGMENALLNVRSAAQGLRLDIVYRLPTITSVLLLLRLQRPRLEKTNGNSQILFANDNGANSLRARVFRPF